MAEYVYHRDGPTWANAYLWPALGNIIASRHWPDKRAFDLGCGNGATSVMLHSAGFEIAGVDTSASGIAIARQSLPQGNFAVASAYDDLAAPFGQFPLVVSLEVIEHCMEPRRFVRTFSNLIAPGGIGVLSTPYHGYLKNLLLSFSGKMDNHFTALWDGGHIKFFSIKSLTALLHEEAVGNIKFLRVGRIPPLAKSMIAILSN